MIGVWIGISPSVLGGSYHAYGSALAASNVLFGLVLAMFPLAAVYRMHPLEELANALLAIWVGVSPWIIGMATILPTIQWSNAASAAAMIMLSLLGLLRVLGPSGQLAGHHNR